MSIPHPVMLIHGIGGKPDDWKTCGLYDYLVNVGGYDPDLIRLFSYGYMSDHGVPKYNYQGDVVSIAHRLSDDPQRVEAHPYQIDRLSAESVAKGGPRKVDIVGYSLGGLVARYYLNCAQPDSYGTQYKGHVGKLIEIGVPNLGSYLMTLYNHVLRGSLLWQLIVLLSRLGLIPIDVREDARAFESTLARWQAAMIEALGDQPIDPDSIAAQQVTPGSAFLKSLNVPSKTPRGVRFFCLYGNLVFDLEIYLFGRQLRELLSLGDLRVPVPSATIIPGATPYLKGYRRLYEFTIGHPKQRTAMQAAALVELPVYSHAHLNDQPDVHAEVLRLLNRL